MSGRRLSERQQRRIQSIQERRRQRLAARVDEALSHDDSEGPREGRIITRHGANLVVQDRSGELLHCLFRQNLGHLVCGDRVVWQPTESGAAAAWA